MVRIRGYGFCPDNCDVDHFHVGHKEGYDCEDMVCNHIIYDERLNQVNNINIFRRNSLYGLSNIGRYAIFNKINAFIYFNCNGVCKTLMEFIQKYWPQLGAFMAVVVTFVTMKVDISVLKEKVKTLFQLMNRDK